MCFFLIQPLCNTSLLFSLPRHKCLSLLLLFLRRKFRLLRLELRQQVFDQPLNIAQHIKFAETLHLILPGKRIQVANTPQTYLPSNTRQHILDLMKERKITQADLA